MRKQRDAILELLEQAVGAAELRLAPHLAGKGVAGITDYWLEPAKAVIAGIKQAPEADREFQVVGELEHTGNISPRPR